MIYILALFLSISGCRGHVVMDPSIQAVQASDYTLAVALTDTMPGRGGDILRVKEGTPIASVWKVILPTGKPMLGGEIEVSYRDTTKMYGVAKSQAVVEIPLAELLGHETWRKEDRGTAVALATIRYKGNETEEIWRARGFAIIVVTDPTYDPLPIDSGFVATKTRCELQSTTAGRTALKCK